MKTFLRILICCFTAVHAFAQSDTINQLDANGKKHGFWRTYYPDSTTIKLEGEYVNGVPCGNYKRYYPNGKIKETGLYRDNHYYGEQRYYYENGQVERVRFYSDTGEKTDTTWYFHSNGKLFSKDIEPLQSQLRTSIRYKVGESVPDTMITVISDSAKYYTLIKDFKLSDTSSVKQFRYKLTYETTYIYQEYLLTLYADSTFCVTRYVYEGCYNYIDKSYGKWKKRDNAIYLNTTAGFTFNHQLKEEDSENLISEDIIASDKKHRRYHFQRVE